MNRPNEILIKRILNGKASPEEASEVAVWFATPDGQEWLSKNIDKDVEELLAGTTPLSDNIPSEELLRRINKAIEKHKKRQWIFRAAAMVIPAVLITALWINLNNKLGGILFSNPEMETITAVYGERKEIVFQDGSKVSLNAGTQISYPTQFGLSERRIRLDGEAYFEITANKRCPFIVELDDASIRVLGTSFGVRAYDHEENVKVMLMDGKVLFEHSDNEYPLKPKHQLTFEKKSGKVHIQRQDNIDDYTSWTDNIITFRDTPLKEVIETLERWYDIQFKVLDEQAFQYTFSFKTKGIPIEDLLNDLQMISPLKFHTKDDVIIVEINK